MCIPAPGVSLDAINYFGTLKMVDDCENSLLEVIRVLVGGETKLLDKNT